jgi:hypothetical protein
VDSYGRDPEKSCKYDPEIEAADQGGGCRTIASLGWGTREKECTATSANLGSRPKSWAQKR